MTTVTRAAIYARISSDSEGLGLGVQRQIADCTAEAQRRGWFVAATFTDNDVSATRSKIRPQYQQLLAAAGSKAIDALVVWDVDRLTRTPRELEDIIDLADRNGLALASVGGEIDLATPQGRMTARIKGSVARHETEQQSRRLKRKFQERAEAGRSHSFTAYGYRRLPILDVDGNRIGVREELHPEQSQLIRNAAAMLLAGQSLRSVAAALNSQGRTSPRGMPWASATLKQILLRDRNAGLRIHLGQVIGDGQWPPLYDRDTHDRVVALLTDPARRIQKGATRKHLLTGIARCGQDGCDGTMVVNVGRVSKDGKRQPPAYVCAACTKIRRKQSSVDELVESVVIARLSRPDALAALSKGDPSEVERNRAEVQALEARLELAADEYASGSITSPQLVRITASLRPKIEAGRAAMVAHLPGIGLDELTGPDAALRWAVAPLDVKRAVIDMLMTVTILASGPGRPFDPAQIRVKPKR